MVSMKSVVKLSGTEAFKEVEAKVSGGNTNAPIIMIAEKGANMIIQDSGRRFVYKKEEKEGK